MSGQGRRPCRDPILRMIERSLRDPETNCTLWQGPKDQGGYGRIRIGSRWQGTRRLEGVHRLAWMTYRGEIPEGMQVCHRCDVRHCWNIDHLYIGTQNDNMDDMWSKRRHGIGPRDRQGRFKSKIAIILTGGSLIACSSEVWPGVPNLPTVTESHPTDDAGRPICADCHAVWTVGDGGEQ